MATLATDTFANRTVSGSFGTGSDGQVWSVDSALTNNVLLSVGSNEGNALYGGSGGDYTIWLYGNTTTKDTDVRCRFSLYNVTSSQFRMVLRYVNSSHYYVLRLDGSGGFLYVNTGSGETLLQSFTIPTLSNGTYYQARFAFLGNSYYVKVWTDGTPEPQAWAYSNMDFSLASAGHYGLGLLTADTASGQGVSVDSFSVIDYSPTQTSSGTPGDRTIYKDQLCKVYTASGTFIDVWRDVPLLAGFKETINAATSGLVIKLPRLFDNFDQANYPGSRGTVALGNIVKYYLYGPGLPQSGLLRYQGRIEDIQPSIDAKSGKETVDVTITPFSAVFGVRGISTSVTFGTSGNPATYVDPLTMADYFFNNNDPLTGLPYLSPLTLDSHNPSSSGVLAQYPFAMQTLDNVMQTILYMLPANYFYRTNPDLTVSIQQTPTTAQHQLYIGQHIGDVKYDTSILKLQNTIVLTGKGGTVSSVKVGSDISVYGQKILLKSDTRLTDAATCAIVAQGLLTTYDLVLLRAPIRVVDYRGDNQTGLGYDIETLKVGDSVVLFDMTAANQGSLWDTMRWDVDQWDFTAGAVFNIVTQIAELDYQFDYVDISLGAPQPKLSRELTKLAILYQDFTMGIQ